MGSSSEDVKVVVCFLLIGRFHRGPLSAWLENYDCRPAQKLETVVLKGFRAAAIASGSITDCSGKPFCLEAVVVVLCKRR